MDSDRTETNQGANSAPAREASAAHLLTRGTRIGRYVVLDLRGRGATGDVYAAYDPELDRKVALKLLRFDHADGDRRAHLIRETRALARLSHPNVITLYDVGAWGDEVFFTMELVDGTELGAWLTAHRGQWPAICSVFLAAGRGLAAAHAVGLVHRDFKPANVLVAHNQTIKVLDFGLATTDIQHEISCDLGAMNDGVVSRTNAVAGTPAYMAPELYRGANADTRADQYAFCVALYEALHGQRPFHGVDAAALQRDKLRGRLPASRTAVPRVLQIIVARGLAPDPTDRFDSMADLLARLERVPARRRLGLGIAGVVVAGLALAAINWDTVPAPAEEGARQVEELWSQPARSRVRAALLATGMSYGESTWNSVQRMLDDYASAWVEGYRRAREATEQRGEQSIAMMDLRLGCLHTRLSELRALIEVLADREAPAVETAVAATGRLTAIEVCSDVEALAAGVTPPDPQIAAEVADLREQLLRIKAFERAGRYTEGLDLAKTATRAAESLAYEPLIAEALLQLGIMHYEMGDPAAAEEALLASATTAERVGLHTTSAAAATEVLYVIGQLQLRFAEAMLWSRHARAAALRPGVPDAVIADFYDCLGMVYAASGRYAEGWNAYAEALHLHERGAPLSLGITLHNMAMLELWRDQFPAALELEHRALTIQERELGPWHPDTAYTLLGLGTIYGFQRELDTSVQLIERALAILTRALGPEHVDVARALINLGAALSLAGRHEEGIVQCERALALLRRRLGDGHHQVGRAMSALGDIRFRMDDLVEAERLYRRALEISETTLGPEHPELASDRNDLANALDRLGRTEEAHALRMRATDPPPTQADGRAP